METTIKTRQLAVLVAMFTVGNSILILPSWLAKVARQDAWISMILSVLAGLLIALLYYGLIRLYPNRTLVQMMSEVFGIWAGSVLSALFLICFPLVIMSLTLRDLGDFLVSQSYSETPRFLLDYMYMIILIMGAALGIRVLARAAEILFPWIVLMFGLLVITLLPNIKLSYVTPVMERGFHPVAIAALPSIGAPFLEIVLFIMLTPLLQSKHKAKNALKAILVGEAVGGTILIVTTLLSVMILSPITASELIYPSYQLGQRISIAHFFERIEAIMATIWFLTIYLKLAVLLYILSNGFAQLFRINDGKLLILPIALIVLGGATTDSPNTIYFNRNLAAWGVYSPIFGIILPCLLLAVALIRRRKKPAGG